MSINDLAQIQWARYENGELTDEWQTLIAASPAGTLRELIVTDGRGGKVYTAAVMTPELLPGGVVQCKPVKRRISLGRYRSLLVRFAPYREETDTFAGCEVRVYDTAAQQAAGVKVGR